MDLSTIAMSGGATEGQKDCIVQIGDKLFKDKEMHLKNGNTVMFKGLEGSSAAAWKQWNENFPKTYWRAYLWMKQKR